MTDCEQAEACVELKDEKECKKFCILDKDFFVKSRASTVDTEACTASCKKVKEFSCQMLETHRLRDHLAHDYKMHCNTNCPIACGFADVIAKNNGFAPQE
jgi:hypothetical protein